MKTIRMVEHWQERDSGQGSVSNPSHHSNNNSNGNLHAQQLGNIIPEPASTSVGSPIDRSTANAVINAAVVLNGGCASVNKVTANQVTIHQQPLQLHEPSHDGQICTRKPAESIRTFSLLRYFHSKLSFHRFWFTTSRCRSVYIQSIFTAVAKFLLDSFHINLSCGGSKTYTLGEKKE